MSENTQYVRYDVRGVSSELQDKFRVACKERRLKQGKVVSELIEDWLEDC